MRCVILLLTFICSSGFLFTTLASGNGWDHRFQGYPEQTEVLQLNVEQIVGMQRMLDEQGIDVGGIDGIIGEKTRAAIRQFQQMQGLIVTGQPDAETLTALGPYSGQQEFFGLAPAFGD